MIPSRPVTLAATLAALTGSAAHAQTGFSLNAGFPVVRAGITVDGGMLVNMDADPDLELVQIVQTQVHALNSDGTSVPGWPRTATVGDGTFGAPSFGDVDGDGEDEVVVQTFFFGIAGDIYAWEKDGTLLPNFPIATGGTLRTNSLADIDNDGADEIITVENMNNQGFLAVYDHTGGYAPGFPIYLNNQYTSGATPSVGDIDADGRLEIVCASYKELFAFEGDGSLEPGFPVSPGVFQAFNYNAATLVDLDRNGTLEIVTASSDDGLILQENPMIHAWNFDGTYRAGFPVEFVPTFATTLTGIFMPPSVADIDADGNLDIIVGNQSLTPFADNEIQAFDRDGNLLPEFPVGPIDATTTQMMVADIDGDQMLEFFCDNNVAGTGAVGVYNHDGTIVTGWNLALGGAFQQCPSIADIDGDGFMDFSLAGMDQVNELVNFHMWGSDSVAWNPDLAPVPTYGYNVKRTFAVPLVVELCPADVNGDGQPSPADFTAWLACFNDPASSPSCSRADVNGDGSISPADFTAWLAAFNAGCGPD